MSLGRLLAAGKSLVGGRDGAGRYRVNKHIALPKFVSPRNPFASTAKADAESASGADAKRAIVIRTLADAGKPAKSNSSVGRRAVRLLGSWGQKINPLPRLARKPGPVKSLIPRGAKTPVQPELSLDKVQVVRNDLSDADFDVVPTKTPMPLSSRTSVSTSPQNLESVGSTWDRLTTRIFGAGQT